MKKTTSLCTICKCGLLKFDEELNPLQKSRCCTSSLLDCNKVEKHLGVSLKFLTQRNASFSNKVMLMRIQKKRSSKTKIRFLRYLEVSKTFLNPVKQRIAESLQKNCIFNSIWLWNPGRSIFTSAPPFPPLLRHPDFSLLVPGARWSAVY